VGLQTTRRTKGILLRSSAPLILLLLLLRLAGVPLVALLLLLRTPLLLLAQAQLRPPLMLLLWQLRLLLLSLLLLLPLQPQHGWPPSQFPVPQSQVVRSFQLRSPLPLAAHTSVVWQAAGGAG